MPDADAGSELDGELALLSAAAIEAGRIAASYFRRDPKAWTKGIDSPVTEADIASDRYLHETLLAARPDYGWLSEETADGPERLTRRRVFVVDPIDGTRGFIEGSPDWCVSVALVEDGRPLVAALVVPTREEHFSAVRGGGARLNGKLLSIGEPEAGRPLRFAGPGRQHRAVARHWPVGDRLYTPSLAYRIALVAAGRIDLATASPNSHDWDLAAADLLVHEAGGTLRDPSGGVIGYNRAITRHPALVAGAPGLVARVAGWIALAEDEAAAGREELR